jgi:hypothetical protein
LFRNRETRSNPVRTATIQSSAGAYEDVTFTPPVPPPPPSGFPANLDTFSRSRRPYRPSVLNAIRRIALGIAVVAAASAILLLSDFGHRERAARKALAKKRAWTIYFVQYNDVIDVKDAEKGVFDITLPPALVRSAQEVIRDANGNRCERSAGVPPAACRCRTARL